MVNTYAAKPMFATTNRHASKPVRVFPSAARLSSHVSGVAHRELRARLCAGILGATIFALGLGVAQGVRGLHATSAAQAVKQTMLHVTVAPGDTLWSLSRRYGSDKANIQEQIDTLAQANALSTGTALVAGERLLVPVTNPTVLARLQTHVASR